MNFIILFIICQVVNVVLNTMKSIITVKGGKFSAAIINALTFGFYTYIVILTAGDGISTTAKMILTALCNLVCVYVVKLIEEKMRKDKLWKIEVTILNNHAIAFNNEIGTISHSQIKLNDTHTLFNIYCNTQIESAKVREIIKKYGAKYFASETKLL